MARQESVLTVFVASPSDVEAERVKLEEIITELNITWSRELGVRLELVKWETHAHPGFSIDPQQVINEQIPKDYDIFIGIMWCRYGTATGRAGSGTVEEFQIAKERYDTDGSVELLNYFKDEPIPPSKLDPTQLQQINNFRDSLGNEGGLHWGFSDISQFEKLIRLHLSRKIQKWLSLQSSKPVESNVALQPNVEVNEVQFDDDGILDLMDIFEDKAFEAQECLARISVAMNDLTDKLNLRSSELNSLPRNEQGAPNQKDVKRVITKSATDMDSYTTRIEAELPLLHDAMEIGLNALIKANLLSIDLNNQGDDNKDQIAACLALKEVIADSKLGVVAFKESMVQLPRMTSILNRAKRGVIGTLDRFLNDLTNIEQLLTETLSAMEAL